jgi:hypothetical protein
MATRSEIFTHAGDVDVARGIAFAKIEIAGEEALGGVIVGVNNDGGEVEPAGLIRNGAGVGGSGNQQSYRAEKTAKQSDERADHQSSERACVSHQGALLLESSDGWSHPNYYSFY